MAKLRMRTKFLLSMLLISAGLTCITLLLMRRRVEAHEKEKIVADLQNSVHTFQDFQRERESTLSRSAELLADLPNLRALMTTRHEATIQDVSMGLWRLAGSDLFVLADRTGRVVAMHTTASEFNREVAQHSLDNSLNRDAPNHWWLGAGHLYEVSLKPIYFGPAAQNQQLGFLIIGYEINGVVASQVSRVAASHVAFYFGDKIVQSTLKPLQQTELARFSALHETTSSSDAEEVWLGGEKFLATSLDLTTLESPSVRLTVLKSYAQTTAFLSSLNQLLLTLGFIAVLGGSALAFVLSHTFTRPLGTLVAGVRALEKGNFDYALDPQGGDEVAEVTGAFKRMRGSLRKTQQDLLEAERLATIGRMASSISHDLRHSLAAVVANAEFLCEDQLSPQQREELYQEVTVAVNQMTDLIESLLEFSRTQESLRRAYGNLLESIDRAMLAIRSHHQINRVQIAIAQEGTSWGWFDSRKLERVFYNLLLNACEAVPPVGGRIEISLRELQSFVEVRVSDNGRGIPEAVRNDLFEPFVSAGKENGTGLGLTVVQKIVQDHGGDVIVESTSSQGTTFRLSIPLGTANRAADCPVESTLPLAGAKPEMAE
jgi:signal transduction histidine kinase